MIHSHNLQDGERPYLTQAATDAVGMHSVIADSSVQVGRQDMTPSELMEAALACCTNMTVRGVLNKRGIPFEDITVDVSMEQVDGKTVITRSVKVISTAPDEQIQAALERAKNCHLYKVLTGEIEVKDA